MSGTREEYREVWKAAYHQLNEKQRQAVDAIDGPVMTIAGPGTGKTELLSIRVGKILLDSDANASNILCLTYTDAGASEMRQRLIKYIGPEAYNVSIYTYHAFCNMVIRDNIDVFGDYLALEQATDLEIHEIFRSMIEEMEDSNPLKRKKGNVYYDIHAMIHLLQKMKQEAWSVEFIEEQINLRISEILDPERTPHIYKSNGKNYKKGDLKMKLIDEEIEKLHKTLAAASQLPVYNKKMKELERFDFSDMILWVIQAFESNELLLLKYQEQYQYIIVDEYQDTNGSQNKLLFLLSSYWDKPNLFIVGDDDQSIFRFQGANMQNIIEFANKFSPETIVLTDNYRSTQVILDYAKNLINNNNSRLVNADPSLTKNIVSKNIELENIAIVPEILQYENIKQQEAGVIQRIKNLVSEGVEYKDIAIIYPKHSLSQNIIKYCNQTGIPINVKKNVNVLKENEAIQILSILRYVSQEYKRIYSKEDELFKILHYNFFGISPLDIGKIGIHIQTKRRGLEPKNLFWREVISSEIMLKEAGIIDASKILSISNLLESWIANVEQVTVQTLFEKILTEGGVLNYLLGGNDKTWKIQIVNTLFDHLKKEAIKAKVFTVFDFLSMIQLMEDSNLELPLIKVISAKNGINFVSAHGSKGLQFKYVFIIGANVKYWEENRGRSNGFKLPESLVDESNDTKIEDQRRLMYVAMTRAKTHLYICYAAKEDNDKDISASKFVTELSPSGIETTESVKEEWVIEYMAELMRFEKGTPILIDSELVDRVLETFKLSATSLTTYLECKLAFYFKKILRVPQSLNVHLAFGNAVHYALEKLFKDIENSNPRSYPQVEVLLSYFDYGLEMYKAAFTPYEYNQYSSYGRTTLTDYYENYKDYWLMVKKYMVECNLPEVIFEGIPLSGKLDRVDVYDQYVSVTDYKTGKPENATSKLKGPEEKNEYFGGSYWQQIYFYRLLLDHYTKENWIMKEGYMDFVEQKPNGEYVRTLIPIEQDKYSEFKRIVKEAYECIKLKEFTPGCNKEDCEWCNFVKYNMPLSISEGDDY